MKALAALLPNRPDSDAFQFNLTRVPQRAEIFSIGLPGEGSYCAYTFKGAVTHRAGATAYRYAVPSALLDSPRRILIKPFGSARRSRRRSRYPNRNPLEHVNALSLLFASRLASIPFRTTPKIRVKGLAIALEFETEQEASRIVERATKNGLLLTSEGPVVLLLPPLTIGRNVAEKGLSILSACA